MRKLFFDAVRAYPFNGRLSKKQVDGLNTLLDVWCREYEGQPDGVLAYCLATAYHETARTMQPIRERGGKRYKNRLYGPNGQNPARAKRMGNTGPDDGYTFDGKGYVQLTWRNNYQRAGAELDIPLEYNPKLAMEPEIAARILFTGCIEGWFTGKRLSNYISSGGADYVNARRVVNGTDRAGDIRAYAEGFERAIAAAGGQGGLLTGHRAPTEEELARAGSRTIKAARANKDGAGALGVGSGLLVAAGPTLETLTEWTDKASDWRGVIDTLTSLAGWAWSSFPYVALAVVAYVLWNNRKIIHARIEDDEKIGRVANG